MSRLIKPSNFLTRYVGFVILFGFISLGAIGGCNDNNAKAQADGNGAPELDFLIDIISGEVAETPEGLILELEVSPIAVFIEEKPGNNSGSMSTEAYLRFFNEVIGDDPPNAILTIRAEDGTAVAVPVKLISVEFDVEESVASFLIEPMDIIDSMTFETSVKLKNIEDIDSPFSTALLFIDALTFIDIEYTGPCCATSPPSECPGGC